MTHAALARAVILAGAEEGIHIGTNTTSVKRMLDGTQPRWPVPRLVAKVLSRRLHRELTVTDCGFADRSPVSDDPYDGLRCCGTLEGTIRTIVELSGRDMRRRKFLQGTAFTAGAFAEPALFALTMAPADATARAAGERRIGMADVEILTEQVAHLRRLDCRHGSGRVREQAVQMLHRDAEVALHGSYTEKTGKALFGAIAQACWLTGFMAQDVGRHSLGQRYYIQALDLAMRAGDRIYAGYLLSQMGRMTVQIGHGTLTEHDRLRHARQTVAPGPGSRLPKGRPPRCSARSCTLRRDVAWHCSVTSAPPGAPSGKPNATTNAPAPARSHRRWATTPTPRSPQTSAAACATSANQATRSS